MTVARYIDPKTQHIFTMTEDEATSRGYKLYGADNSVPEPATDTEPDAPGMDADTYPKHVGGGHYELSNGERVKGKEEAAEMQAVLNAESDAE